MSREDNGFSMRADLCRQSAGHLARLRQRHGLDAGTVAMQLAHLDRVSGGALTARALNRMIGARAAFDARHRWRAQLRLTPPTRRLILSRAALAGVSRHRWLRAMVLLDREENLLGLPPE